MSYLFSYNDNRHKATKIYTKNIKFAMIKSASLSLCNSLTSEKLNKNKFLVNLKETYKKVLWVTNTFKIQKLNSKEFRIKISLDF